MGWEFFWYTFTLLRNFLFYVISACNVTGFVLFVKAAKAISLGILFIPFTGCAIGVGLIFASLLKSVSYAPDYEEILFNYAMLGFAFIETFAFLLFFILAVIIAF